MGFPSFYIGDHNIDRTSIYIISGCLNSNSIETFETYELEFAKDANRKVLVAFANWSIAR